MLTDEAMRDALVELVEAYEARLKRPNGKGGDGFHAPRQGLTTVETLAVGET